MNCSMPRRLPPPPRHLYSLSALSPGPTSRFFYQQEREYFAKNGGGVVRARPEPRWYSEESIVPWTAAKVESRLSRRDIPSNPPPHGPPPAPNAHGIALTTDGVRLSPPDQRQPPLPPPPPPLLAQFYTFPALVPEGVINDSVSFYGTLDWQCALPPPPRAQGLVSRYCAQVTAILRLSPSPIPRVAHPWVSTREELPFRCRTWDG